MRWEKSWFVHPICSRALEKPPTPLTWTDKAQDRDMDHKVDWKLACLAQKTLSGASQPGQTSVVSSEGQWYLTSSSKPWLTAQSAVWAALHITENWEQFKHQRVVMTLRSASKWWRKGLTTVPCSSKGSAEPCACGGKTPCTGIAWKPNSQKAALQNRTCSSNELNTSQEGALARATSTWAAPEQHCQHFGSGDPSSHASFTKCLHFCCFEFFWRKDLFHLWYF